MENILIIANLKNCSDSSGVLERKFSVMLQVFLVWHIKMISINVFLKLPCCCCVYLSGFDLPIQPLSKCIS